MDLVSMLGVLGRRWYLTVPLVVASLVGVVAFVGTGPSGYKAQGTVVVLPPRVVVNPKSPAAITEVNPYLQLSGWQTIVTGLLAAKMSSPQFHSDVTAKNVRSSWTVTEESGVPVLDLSVTNQTAQGAVNDASVIFDQTTKALRDMQTAVKAPADQQATVSFSVAPSHGVAQYGHVYKVGGALGVVFLGLSAALVYVADALFGRRRRKRDRLKASGRDVSGDAPSGVATSGATDAPDGSRQKRRKRSAATRNPSRDAATTAAGSLAAPVMPGTTDATGYSRTGPDDAALGYARREH